MEEWHHRRKELKQLLNKKLLSLLPLMSPRSRSPMKKGKKQMKFHKEATNPFGGSIFSVSPTPDLPNINRNASDNHTQNFPHTTKAQNAKTSFPKTHNNNLRKIYTLPYFLHLATMKLRGTQRNTTYPSQNHSKFMPQKTKPDPICSLSPLEFQRKEDDNEQLNYNLFVETQIFFRKKNTQT